MKIETKFDLFQKVYIPELKINGKILNIFIDCASRIQYRVRYFDAFKVQDVYFDEDEISDEFPKTPIGYEKVS